MQLQDFLVPFSPLMFLWVASSKKKREIVIEWVRDTREGNSSDTKKSIKVSWSVTSSEKCGISVSRSREISREWDRKVQKETCMESDESSCVLWSQPDQQKCKKKMKSRSITDSQDHSTWRTVKSSEGEGKERETSSTKTETETLLFVRPFFLPNDTTFDEVREKENREKLQFIFCIETYLLQGVDDFDRQGHQRQLKGKCMKKSW